MGLNSTWNTIQYGFDQALDACALPLQLTSKALDDVNISNTLFKTIQLTTEITSSFFVEMGSGDLVPAIFEPLSKAFDGFTSVAAGRRWVKDLAFFANNRDFAWANPIGEYPNFFAIGSRVIGFGNDLVEGWKWASKVRLLPEIPKTIGQISLFGYQTVVVTLADCQDGANLAMGLLDLTDNSRGFVTAVLNGGNYLGKAIDVLSSGLNVAGTVLWRIDDPMVKIASKVCRLAATLITLTRWVMNQPWGQAPRNVPPLFIPSPTAPGAPEQGQDIPALPVNVQEGNRLEGTVGESEEHEPTQLEGVNQEVVNQEEVVTPENLQDNLPNDPEVK